jgi:hypothetical protein
MSLWRTTLGFAGVEDIRNPENSITVFPTFAQKNLVESNRAAYSQSHAATLSNPLVHFLSALLRFPDLVLGCLAQIEAEGFRAWRAAALFLGLVCATVSTGLSSYLYVHAMYTAIRFT